MIRLIVGNIFIYSGRCMQYKATCEGRLVVVDYHGALVSQLREDTSCPAIFFRAKAKAVY